MKNLIRYGGETAPTQNSVLSWIQTFAQPMIFGLNIQKRTDFSRFPLCELQTYDATSLKCEYFTVQINFAFLSNRFTHISVHFMPSWAKCIWNFLHCCVEKFVREKVLRCWRQSWWLESRKMVEHAGGMNLAATSENWIIFTEIKHDLRATHLSRSRIECRRTVNAN